MDVFVGGNRKGRGTAAAGVQKATDMSSYRMAFDFQQAPSRRQYQRLRRTHLKADFEGLDAAAVHIDEAVNWSCHQKISAGVSRRNRQRLKKKEAKASALHAGGHIIASDEGGRAIDALSNRDLECWALLQSHVSCATNRFHRWQDPAYASMEKGSYLVHNTQDLDGFLQSPCGIGTVPAYVSPSRQLYDDCRVRSNVSPIRFRLAEEIGSSDAARSDTKHQLEANQYGSSQSSISTSATTMSELRQMLDSIHCASDCANESTDGDGLFQHELGALVHL